MGGGGDAFHRHPLAGVVLDAAEHHTGEAVALLGDAGFDVLRPQGVLSLPRSEFDEVVFRVEAVQPQLGQGGIPVTREGALLNHELGALPVGPVEGHEEQVQVDR